MLVRILLLVTPPLPKAMYRKRSRLGLLGSSLDVNTHEWSSRETTIGPGSDSYYEYLLKVLVAGVGPLHSLASLKSLSTC